jgi:hypothetical protein
MDAVTAIRGVSLRLYELGGYGYIGSILNLIIYLNKHPLFPQKEEIKHSKRVQIIHFHHYALSINKIR